MRKLNNQDIEALVDNELHMTDKQMVCALIDSDPAANKHYNDLMLQKQLLIQWFKGLAIEQ